MVFGVETEVEWEVIMGKKFQARNREILFFYEGLQRVNNIIFLNNIS